MNFQSKIIMDSQSHIINSFKPCDGVQCAPVQLQLYRMNFSKFWLHFIGIKLIFVKILLETLSLNGIGNP